MSYIFVSLFVCLFLLVLLFFPNYQKTKHKSKDDNDLIPANGKNNIDSEFSKNLPAEAWTQPNFKKFKKKKSGSDASQLIELDTGKVYENEIPDAWLMEESKREEKEQISTNMFETEEESQKIQSRRKKRSLKEMEVDTNNNGQSQEGLDDIVIVGSSRHPKKKAKNWIKSSFF
ncbi:hypothetical protein RFI_23291 [Reticulomyxa filosa]|uniref:Uncharacterized protein n=1 Tax=Reticulomyxa filosa TaxID=46433 RepID=X6MLW3_RETFI|nr:hypothetical protein RFI_23291 [Reticulomyxa filosa]|eukprot:ETO14075.1 hypothetical protein RFI_23291 [Reticulomyxa filosa]